MEIITEAFKNLFVPKGYHLDDDSSQIGPDKAQLTFSKVDMIENESQSVVIKVRIAFIPLSNEILLYIHAPKLVSKIISLKLTLPKSIDSYPSFFRSNLTRGMMMVLYPPVASAPALSHLPDSALHAIGMYLNVYEAIALLFSNRRFAGYYPQNELLWSLYYQRDFPALASPGSGSAAQSSSSSSSSTSNGGSANVAAVSYLAYKVDHLIKLQHNRALQRQHHQVMQHFVHWTPPLPYPDYDPNTMAPPLGLPGMPIPSSNPWAPPLPYPQPTLSDPNRSRDTWF